MSDFGTVPGADRPKIMVVDDEEIIRMSFCEILELNGFSTVEAANGQEALKVRQAVRPAAVLLDLKMPGLSGIDTLKELKKAAPDLPVIIITSHGDVPTAVEAIQMGAYDFMLKPPDFEGLLIKLRRALERQDLVRKVAELNSRIEASLESSLGSSQAMKKIIAQMQQVAFSSFSVIIQGETGTGKSYIANLIHNLSPRAKAPFVTVDLGIIPETLVESELFGHERGAFTGADRRKKGFFEAANGGTIFLDEIQNVSPYLQSKLLRVVEERTIQPLGSDQSLDIDIRIIAASNTDIQFCVKAKNFREDLYYRLCEFMIHLTPLRERPDDILFLAGKFCAETARELDRQIPGISEEAAALLKDHSWPGNIRELRNVIKRALLLSDSNVITPEHISFLAFQGEAPEQGVSMKGCPVMSLEAIEKDAIKQTLIYTGGNKSKAAAILQIDYTTLLRKIKQYSLSL